tara:strand:- start:282 stop:2366 length:2085 start_codon:yes stop_codon:yes gene_type:complete
MVLSIINNDINYIESNIIEKSDIEYETYIYKAKIYNKDIKFVLGKPNFQHIDNNIVYFNIYLINANEIISKIGIYETNNTIYRSLLDSEGNIIVEKLDSPILFSFTKSLIKNNYILKNDDFEFKEDEDEDEKDDDEDEDDGEEDEDEEDTDNDTSDDSEDKKEQDILSKTIKKSQELVIIKEQTKEESEEEIRNYIYNVSHSWVEKFMKSTKYSLKDNEGGGDCFFAVIRDALKSSNSEKYYNITVSSIRNKLAQEATDETLSTYKEFANYFIGGSKKSQEKIKELKKRHKTYKLMIQSTNNGEEKNNILEKAKGNLSEISVATDSSKEYQELAEEFEFMKDVSTLDDLKRVIKSRTYWADQWAISTLERIYNIKFIILSKDEFDESREENPLVLQCGEGDKKLFEKTVFEPEYYIIADYEDRVHYKLVTYDKNINKGAFKYRELPYKIKELILDSCMAKNSGLFSIIPDFINFASLNSVKIKYKDPVESEPLLDKSFIKSKTPEYYDDSIILQIYNKSNDSKKAGEGTGESIAKELKTSSNILKLNKKKDWRKKLDNNWIMNSDEILEINGKYWNSVQHYLYAFRFSNIPEIYDLFVKDSENIASKTVEDAKIFHDKMLKDKTYKSKIKSEEVYKKEYSEALTRGLMAKFSIDEYKEILLLTDNALIYVYKHRSPREKADKLMKIRLVLAKKL